MKSVLAEVQVFFQRHAVVGLKLPTGWFGRPYDNLFNFTAAKIIDEHLHIAFLGGEELVMRGNLQVECREQSLVISGFSFLEWSWQFYGSDTYETRTYSAGRLEFLARPFESQFRA